MPRNDELVNNHDNKTAAYIRKYYNIPADNKIILYAPTYRKGKRNEATDYNLDVRGIVEAAKERFGGEWTILYRMHYFIKKRLPADTKGQHIIDVTDYGDMQDLLLAADILITDYSSSVWDYSLLKRPCFLYTTDLDEYLETQGFTWMCATGHSHLLKTMPHWSTILLTLTRNSISKMFTNITPILAALTTETQPKQFPNAFCRNARNEDNYESWNYQY